MADPYWRYNNVPPPSERGGTPRSRFPGHLSSDVSTLTYHQWSSSDATGSADFLKKDFLPSHPGAYGIDGIRGMPEPSAGGGLPGGIRHVDYSSPLRDPSLLGQRRDVPSGIIPKTEDRIIERPNSLRRPDPVATGESNILFIDGLPTDCTRREVGHLFRPFIGFRDLKVVHKEPRRSGDKARVLCFVEFTDARCALTAMEALQGYKFDDRKPDSPILKVYFAHFPFQLPSDRDD